MKAYCENCTSSQPSSFRPGNDAVTGEVYEDLRCNTCGFIVATVQERVAQPEQEPEVCCGDYATCMKPCTPRGRWLAEQEPVAYPEGDVVGPCVCGSWPGGKCLKCPRITTTPKRKPLTDEQLEQRIGYRLPAYGFDAIRQLIKENT